MSSWVVRRHAHLVASRAAVEPARLQRLRLIAEDETDLEVVAAAVGHFLQNSVNSLHELARILERFSPDDER